MSIILENQLSACSISIVQLLFYYRALNGKQVAEMHYVPHGPTESQRKSIYNYLAKLKKQGIIASRKIEGDRNAGSLYYLTAKGYELAKDLLNVEGGSNTGFILMNELQGTPTQADLPYDLYKPPFQQLHHHLLLNEFFIRLRRMEEVVDHRGSIYSARNYTVDGKSQKLRPDAEILLPDHRSYFIEIDRSSENHSQLRNKFKNYKDYFDWLLANKKALPAGIIVVVEEKRKMYGFNRRWINVLTAFLEEIGEYATGLNLLMTTVSEVAKTLWFEIHRRKINEIAKVMIKDHFETNGFHKVISVDYKKELFLSYAFHHKSYTLIFSRITNQYESINYALYKKFLTELTNYQRNEALKGYNFAGTSQFIVYDESEPFLLKDFSATEVDEQLKTRWPLFFKELEMEKIPDFYLEDFR
ncbi:hypothetical protein C0971_16215 [Bacillus methanolicus]|uniref:replication-relaxation family protein n=1 Tax=Bacillus methanolicus TaxID=1471 RepID=UPI00200E1154|nr:replication-relaxation family protein [Bacillus methanolicus]UQD53391.1 hypothetical protein C0971_16215 [Bacillus methanolicus]